MNMLKNNEQKENEIKTRPWTNEDKAMLIELYPNHTNKELCIILEKTEGQLRGMKERLGLNSKYNKPLTESEQKKIIEYYNNHQDYLDLDTFSKDLGRSKISISRYAGKKQFNKA